MNDKKLPKLNEEEEENNLHITLLNQKHVAW